MSQTMQLLLNRKSVRAYEDREVGEEVKGKLLAATLRAPTAGNLMLYSIIEVRDQAAKDTLVRTCDNQPFIAKAPLVLLFLADYQRWVDHFAVSGVEELCRQEGRPVRAPEEGDLFLACCDALIAAQTAVIAAVWASAPATSATSWRTMSSTGLCSTCPATSFPSACSASDIPRASSGNGR